MDAGMQFDVRKFTQALRDYKTATGKDCVDVLNRAARNVAYRASSATAKGSASRIRSELMRDPHLRYALTSIALKKRGIGALKSPEFAKEVARFVSRRASSAGYLRAAWASAIQQLGGTFRGTKFRGASGFANKATVRRLISEIVAITNQPSSVHAAGAEKIGLKALQAAIDFVADDMENYARQLMAKTARQYSG